MYILCLCASSDFVCVSQHGNLVSLSEQSLVDCSWGYGNNGCDGGESERSYKWIMKNGCIPTEFTYGQYLMQVSSAFLSFRQNSPVHNVHYTFSHM